MLNWLKNLLKGNIMFENIDAQAFEKEAANNKNAVILDVRTADEYSSGHLENAVNVDFNAPDFRSRLETLDKSKKYLVYCRSGARSFNACNIMSQTGFDQVVNMQGGIMSWRGKVTA